MTDYIDHGTEQMCRPSIGWTSLPVTGDKESYWHVTTHWEEKDEDNLQNWERNEWLYVSWKSD